MDLFRMENPATFYECGEHLCLFFEVNEVCISSKISVVSVVQHYGFSHLAVAIYYIYVLFFLRHSRVVSNPAFMKTRL